MLATLRQDLRLAARLLWSSPLFTLVAVACIAIGSGAVTTIVSAGNAMVLRPLAGSDDGSRLIRIERKQPGGSDGVSLSYPWYTAMRDASQTLGGLAAWGKASLVLRGGSGPGDAVYGSLVSGNLFDVVGVRPLLGRFFLPEEDRTELTHPVLVVSERYWRAHLGADSAAVGRDLLVNGRPFTLIGVAPSPRWWPTSSTSMTTSSGLRGAARPATCCWPSGPRSWCRRPGGPGPPRMGGPCRPTPWGPRSCPTWPSAWWARWR